MKIKIIIYLKIKLIIKLYLKNIIYYYYLLYFNIIILFISIKNIIKINYLN